MAATTYGTAHLYGIAGTVTNATVMDFKRDQTCKNTAETQNESGNEIERRYDDKHFEGSITLRIRGAYTMPVAADTIVYNSVTYEITKVGEAQTNKGHRTVELGIKSSEYITYT